MKRAVTVVLMIITAVVLAAGCGKGREDRTAYRLEGIEKLDAGDYEGALRVFGQAIELSKSRGTVGRFEIDVLKYRGEAEYRSGDYAAAARTYDTLMKVDKRRPVYLYLSCMANARAGSLERALEDYTGAAGNEVDEGLSKKALEALGDALEEAGETEKAVTLYQQQAAGGEMDAWVCNRMGLARMREKNYEEALDYFSQGILTGDEALLPELSYNQAVVYEYMGDFAKALEGLEDYAARYGSDPELDREIAFLKTR